MTADLPEYNAASVAMGGVPIPPKPKGGELVRRHLDLSTAHLPEETAAAIDAGIFPKRPTMASEYGWLFNVPDPADLPETAKEWPCEAFRLVMQRAALLGCDFVLFDRDGALVEDLPFYEW